jgi:hypothetical protein
MPFAINLVQSPAALVLIGLSILFLSPSAQAVPSFSRQTGAACAMCHTTAFGPNLTPYGREFKLNGYVWDKGDSKETYIPPISGMVQGSFTNTKQAQDPPPGPSGFNANNNFAFDQASLFYAGKIWGKVGAFSQLTYNGVDDTLALDNTDVRFANQVDLFDQDVVYGISANNNPTVQDLWNTTPAWGFPFTSSPVAPTPAAATMLDGGLSGVGTGQVGGATFYAMVNRLVYLEAGAYGSFSRNFMIGTGNYNNWGNPPLNRIDGGAPYWRVTLQKDWDGHYFALGHYGMSANVYPYADKTGGTDNYTDLAMDATYQYLGNMDHIAELRTTYIRENRDLKASANIGNVLNRTNYVNTFKINGTYTYSQTYSVALGYNKNWARTDTTLDSGTGLILPGGNNGNEYFTAELAYVPFGKTYTALSSLMNLRMALQYIGYTQFDGSQYQVGNNNTFLISGWLAF